MYVAHALVAAKTTPTLMERLQVPAVAVPLVSIAVISLIALVLFMLKRSTNWHFATTGDN